MSDLSRKIIPGYTIGEGLFKWICDNIDEGAYILELGSGQGSYRLAEQGYKMNCIEHNPAWMNVYPLINYIYCPIKDGWYNLISVVYYDVLLIDGPPSPRKRSKFLDNTKFFNLSKKIIIDDTNREDELYLAKELSKITGRKMVTIKDGSKRFSIV